MPRRRRIDRVGAGIRGNRHPRSDRFAVEAHGGLGQAGDEDDDETRHAFRRIEDAPVDEPEHVARVLGACFVRGGLVVAQGRDEVAEVLFAERRMVPDSGRELDLGDAFQLLERVAPALRVFVLFGRKEEIPRRGQLRVRRTVAGVGDARRKREQEDGGQRELAHRSEVHGPRSALPERRPGGDPAGIRLENHDTLCGMPPPSPTVLRRASDLADCATKYAGEEIALAFVPTMGALHAGTSGARARGQAARAAGRGVDFREPDAVRAGGGPLAVPSRPRGRSREARARGRRRGVCARGRRALPRRGRDAGARRAAGRTALRTHSPRALRGRRDHRREAIRHRRTERRRLRKEGLPAAPRHPSHGARSVPAGRDRRRPDGPRAGRSGDELAQRVSLAGRASASESPRPSDWTPPRAPSRRESDGRESSRDSPASPSIGRPHPSTTSRFATRIRSQRSRTTPGRGPWSRLPVASARRGSSTTSSSGRTRPLSTRIASPATW